jgi:hypothetical protein
MGHPHKTYTFYLNYALAAEREHDFLKANYWLGKALAAKA